MQSEFALTPQMSLQSTDAVLKHTCYFESLSIAMSGQIVQYSKCMMFILFLFGDT